MILPLSLFGGPSCDIRFVDYHERRIARASRCEVEMEIEGRSNSTSLEGGEVLKGVGKSPKDKISRLNFNTIIQSRRRKER